MLLCSTCLALSALEASRSHHMVSGVAVAEADPAAVVEAGVGAAGGIFALGWPGVRLLPGPWKLLWCPW